MTTITELANASSYSYNTIKGGAMALLWENIAHFHGDETEIRDTIYEVVDNVLPIYYQDVLACILSDGLNLDFDDRSEIAGSKSLVAIMQSRISEQLNTELHEELEAMIEEWQGEQGCDEEESIEATQWYCMSDEKAGPCVISYHDTLEEAKVAVNERFNVLGKPCHVEDDTSSEWLYTPEGHPESQEVNE
jgi:hypothetical protein